jgi:hypothetical protein
VTEVIRLDVAGEPAISPENGSTIDELFDLIDEGLAVADQVEVVYDAETWFSAALRDRLESKRR